MYPLNGGQTHRAANGHVFAMAACRHGAEGPHLGDTVERLRASASASGFPDTRCVLWTGENSF